MVGLELHFEEEKDPAPTSEEGYLLIVKGRSRDRMRRDKCDLGAVGRQRKMTFSIRSRTCGF